MEEKFSQLTLDVIGLSLFHFNFDSLTAVSPVIDAVYTALEEVSSLQLRDELLSMLVAGHETTGSGIAGLIALDMSKQTGILIDENALIKISCVHILRILVAKADTEIDELENDLVLLRSELIGDIEGSLSMHTKMIDKLGSRIKVMLKNYLAYTLDPYKFRLLVMDGMDGEWQIVRIVWVETDWRDREQRGNWEEERQKKVKEAVKVTKKLSAVMLNTVGAELQVVGMIKNSVTLTGTFITLGASQIHIDLTTLTNKDNEVIITWGVQNKIDFLSLSYARHVGDVRRACEFLSKNGTNKVFNQDLYFKEDSQMWLCTHSQNLLFHSIVGKPMTHFESIASPAVQAAIEIKASVFKCYTSSGRVARLIANYRPTMPVLLMVIPRLTKNQLK